MILTEKNDEISITAPDSESQICAPYFSTVFSPIPWNRQQLRQRPRPILRNRQQHAIRHDPERRQFPASSPACDAIPSAVRQPAIRRPPASSSPHEPSLSRRVSPLSSSASPQFSSPAPVRAYRESINQAVPFVLLQYPHPARDRLLPERILLPPSNTASAIRNGARPAPSHPSALQRPASIPFSVHSSACSFPSDRPLPRRASITRRASVSSISFAGRNRCATH